MLLLFACSAIGPVLALVYIKSTTEELRRVSETHRIEGIRQRLILAVQGAQADLFAASAHLGPAVDAIAQNITELEESADACTQCHHTPDVAARLAEVRAKIGDYEAALSYYMTASANIDRITRLKLDAATTAADLLRTTEEMAVQATRRAEARSVAAMGRFDEARRLLTLALVFTFAVALLGAFGLSTSITRPVEALVRATRALQAGELGVSIESRDKTELGELSRHFDAMSAALREGYAALQSEIEERKRAESRLLYDAFHDGLTGLPNRALFQDRLQHVIESGRRHAEQLYAVLFLDLDRFKVINDTLGHLVGDHLLVAIGERLADCLRPGDTVARLGGDEFGILLDRLGDASDATMVSERIQTGLSKPIEVDGHELFVSASIGIALRSERYQRPEQVLRDADIAMYQAKTRGKACTEVFDAEMHGSVVDRLQLETDLRRAVEHGSEELLLHYQPIVALRTGKLIGIEALVRWDKPGRGILDAAEFVSLAEESGMVVPMGEWVVRTACAQLRAWHDRVPSLAGVTVSLNVSGQQFRRPTFVEDLWRNVRDAGVDPRFVAIEVTEAVIMDEVEASAAKLSRLRDLGIQIHVDDFGTGYSSLSYLHRFPITAVKIDQSFVAGLPGHVESEEVIKAIVSIAESLDFDVIAEGVESPTQVEKLEELRCRYGQGLLLAKPVPAAELEAWANGARGRSVA